MADYEKQLTGECTNPNCTRIFCRRNYSYEFTPKISGVLSNYSEIFYCENIEKLIRSVQPKYHYPIIDLYFYTVQLAYKQPVKYKSSEKVFFLKKLKNTLPKKIFRDQKCTETKKNTVEPNHQYCTLINSQLDKADMYLMVGITHLLLLKFQKKNNLTLALVIIKLFQAVSRSSKLDSTYYKSLHNVYAFIYKKLGESGKLNQLLESNNRCDSNTLCNSSNKNLFSDSKIIDNFEKTEKFCLFDGEFTSNDLVNSVDVVSAELDCSIITNVRENDRIKHLLNIFLILFSIDQKNYILGFKKFYLPNFSRKLDLKTEFKYYKARYDTVLNYGFVLSLEAKSALIKIINVETMKAALQDAFFKSLFEGVTSPYLVFKICREHVYKDTLQALENINVQEMRKQLKIQFIGEEGVDLGGIIREYFKLLSEDIKNDRDVFDIKNDRLWFRRGVDLLRLKKIGNVFGIALYNDVLVNVPLPYVLFKKMLGSPTSFEDLREIEPQHYQSVANLEKCSDKEIAKLELTFVVNGYVDGEDVGEELIPDGKNVYVTKDNFEAFKEAYAEFYLEKSVEKEIYAFIEGFKAVGNAKTISMLHPKELEKIIVGTENYNFKSIESCVSYVGYTIESQIIKYFWEIFHNFSFQKKKTFLQFITGHDRLPATGFGSLKLVIIKNGSDSDRLPSSQTCFNTLLLPEYATKDKLYDKLNKALNLTSGFYLV